jgi:hypothetical protein
MNFKYYSQTIGGWIWMIPTDLTSNVWKLNFPTEYATIHTDGHVADKIELTTHMNTELE